MKAVLCTRFGPPSSLTVDDVPSPSPAPGQVVIAVHASAVNFPDTLIIENKYQFKPPLPFSPGAEVAGTVTALGAGVREFAVGDRVLAIMNWGGYAEEVAVDVQKVHRLPDNVDFLRAAALVLTYGTSFYALKHRGQLRQGETVLVLGAAGGTGLAAVELSKAMGGHVIAAASTVSKLAVCAEKGAEKCLNYGAGDLRDLVKAATGGAGVDVVYDPVGGSHTEAALRNMAWGGRYLVIGFSSGEIPRPPLNLPLLKSCSITGVFFGAFMDRDPSAAQALIAELLGMLEAGRINPVITGRYRLEDAAEALTALTSRQAVGKCVLTTARGREHLEKGSPS